MNRLRALLPAALLLLAAPLQAQLPRATPEQVGMSSERLDRLSTRIQHYIDDGSIAGAVTLVARHGNVVRLEAQGYRDREARDPMEADDIFVLMSMTKPIVSTALMMLFEQGEFLLTDPVSKWLPEFESMAVYAGDEGGQSRFVDAQPITIRHLLTHTAGLSSGRGAPRTPEYQGEEWVNPSPASRPHADDSPLRASVRSISRTPLNFQPGTQWEYGSATDVVAALVEEISGEKLDRFLRTRIFDPLGMHDTWYNVPRSEWDRMARVYSPDPNDGNRAVAREIREPTPTEFFGGVAGLSSTAADYFRFAQMVLNGGELDGARILSPKTVDLMITNHIGNLHPEVGRGPGYGFGLGYSVLLDPGQSRESLTPGSYGWSGAWGTYYVTDPTEELISILMIQLTPYNHINIRQDPGTIATQAILEPHSSGDQTVRGYLPIH